MEIMHNSKQKDDLLPPAHHHTKPMLAEVFLRYLSEDVNGSIYVSKKPMNQRYFSTISRLKCIATKSLKITRKGVFVGAICKTIDNEILKIVKVKNRQGYERKYIREGSL